MDIAEDVGAVVCVWSVKLVQMAEGDWDEVTIIRKRAPKAGQLKTPQVPVIMH